MVFLVVKIKTSIHCSKRDKGTPYLWFFANSGNTIPAAHAQQAVKHVGILCSKRTTFLKKVCTKGTDHPNEKCLAFRWQLCRAGFVCRGWSGAVYVARRPDLFQLCPGKKIFSPVSLDSLEIYRGPWKIGGLQYHVWVGVGGGWIRNMVFYIILVQRGDGLFCVWWAKLNLDLWLQPCLLIVLRWLWLSSGRQVMLTGLAKETFKFESNLWFSPKMIHSSLGILGKPSDICHLPRTT